MALDIILTILGTVCIVIGIIGCILPVLPGPPLSYVGILLLHFTSRVEFSIHFLVIWAIVVIAVQLFDYYVPVWGTKKLGGSKYGAWGCAIGAVAGIFIFPPWGFIVLPLIGAVIGELINDKDINTALKAGLGAFLGFITGVVIKLIVAISLAVFFFSEVFNNIL